MKNLSESSETLAASPEQSCWYRAATLAERAACWSEQDAAHLLSTNGRKEKAERAFQNWKAQRPFGIGSFFAERLAMDGITEEDLLALLQEPQESLQERLSHLTAPDWVKELQEALETDYSDFPLLVGQENIFQGFAVLQPFAPLFYGSVVRLHAAIQKLVGEYEALPFDPQTILALLLPNLFQQIGGQVSSTLVLELNIARLRGQLREESPQERFREYLTLLCQRSHLLPLLQEYSVLARQVLRDSQLWAKNSQAFLERLCADWQEIRSVFTPEQDPGPLAAIQGSAGDPHRGRQSVMILTFHSGWRLVYKPRTLAVDAHFQELLSWLNAQGAQPPFRVLKLVTKASHGWVEFITFNDCASEEEVRHFYERQGGYLALMYALEASDFHHENVLAAGEHPMLIDLEALLQPRFRQDKELITPAQHALDYSVLHRGLLPLHLYRDKEGERFDISGLALQSEGRLSPVPIPQWEGEGTDEMRLVRKQIEMERGYNCPRLRDQDVQPLDYLEQVASGFTSLYRLLLANREELLADWLPRCAQDETRFVVRSTRIYWMMSRDSFHPNQLRDALKRERFLDYLWMDVPNRPLLKLIIPAERAALWEGDIPMFSTHPESPHLWTNLGECLPDFFEKSGLEAVEERIRSLSEQDLFRQNWVIWASFTDMASAVTPASANLPLYRAVEQQVAPLRYTGAGLVGGMPVARSWLTEAQAIGDWLGTLGLQEEGQADWFGINYAETRGWQVLRAGLDLYNGLPGILLFLAYLGQITEEARYTALAQAGMRTVLRLLETQRQISLEYIDIGAFTGVSSCIYLFSHLAVLWQDQSLLQEAEELVQHLPEVIEKDEKYNLMDGVAGCLASLLSLYRVAPSEQTLHVAKLCGEHLLTHSRPGSEGPMWEVQQEGPLSGFSQGVAGIAWSLFRLAEVSGEERFHAAARAALEYEHSVIDQHAHQDESAAREEVPAGMSWSSGAPAIALGRLVSLSYLGDARMRTELDTALETTLAQGFGYPDKRVGPNHSLAYGDCGTLEIVLLAAQKLGMAPLHEALERQTGQLLACIQQHGWLMPVPLNVPVPGLLLGLAGMGYQCLRLAAPDRVPSVLSLTPPSADLLP